MGAIRTALVELPMSFKIYIVTSCAARKLIVVRWCFTIAIGWHKTTYYILVFKNQICCFFFYFHENCDTNHIIYNLILMPYIRAVYCAYSPWWCSFAIAYIFSKPAHLNHWWWLHAATAIEVKSSLSVARSLCARSRIKKTMQQQIIAYFSVAREQPKIKSLHRAISPKICAIPARSSIFAGLTEWVSRGELWEHAARASYCTARACKLTSRASLIIWIGIQVMMIKKQYHSAICNSDCLLYLWTMYTLHNILCTL